MKENWVAKMDFYGKKMVDNLGGDKPKSAL
jgi:hypothetical protein